MFKIDRTSGFLIRTSEFQNPLVRRTSGFQNFCRTLNSVLWDQAMTCLAGEGEDLERKPLFDGQPESLVKDGGDYPYYSMAHPNRPTVLHSSWTLTTDSCTLITLIFYPQTNTKLC